MRSKLIFIIIFLLVLSLPLTGALCKKEEDLSTEPITIKVWLIYEDKKNFDDFVLDFQSEHRNLSFEFEEKNMSISEYEKELIDAIAANRAPDIAMMKEDWIDKHYDKLIEMPAIGDKSQDDLSNEMREVFVQAVPEKMIVNNRIYGIPFKMDTLALYYNVSHFNEAELEAAPKTWEEFIHVVKKLTKRDQFGKITRSAVALGTSNNVDHSQDILYALMIQNGTKMISDDHRSAAFNTSITKASGQLFYPGTNALDFYNSFSNPAKETYTWNSAMPNSLRAFVDGQTSMIFDYQYRESEIYNLNPNLRFRVAPLPQIKDTTSPATYPSFWAYSITNNSKHAKEAWSFIRFLSQSSSSVKKEKTKTTYENIIVGPSVFKGQPYIARVFYKSKEPEEVDIIFSTMIQNAAGGQPAQAAIDSAAAAVTSILQTKG